MLQGLVPLKAVLWKAEKGNCVSILGLCKVCVKVLAVPSCS